MTIEGNIAHFDKEKNFWDEYPNLLLMQPFKKFHGRDRSAEKKRSSAEMWGFAFLYDMGPANFLRNIAFEKRKVLVANDILETPKYDFDKEKAVRDRMKELCQPSPQRSLDALLRKLDVRAEFIEDTNYTLDGFTEKGKLKKGTADQLDRMMVNSGKIYEQVEFWQRKVIMERDTRKDKKKTESESGDL
jgi:hypothetical protein